MADQEKTTEPGKRFLVTVNDRATNRIQQYETDRILAAYCTTHGDGEAWIVSFRCSSREQIGEAIATILDRTFELDPSILEHVGPALGRVPQTMGLVDYAQDEPTLQHVDLTEPPEQRG